MSAIVTIVPTGAANTASVMVAFERLGVTTRPADTPDDVEGAERLVLPGVGAFAAAMNRIDNGTLREPLVRRVTDGRPTLAICLGLQLLAEASEESPGAAGLGVVPDTVTRFSAHLTVPQLGWNRVDPDSDSRFVEPGWAYFANSYKLDSVPDGWVGAWTGYGSPFVSTIERDAVLACQFHPELSGPWGSGILERWLDGTGGRS